PLSFVEGRWGEVRADAITVLDETSVRTPWRDAALAMLGLLAQAQGDTALAQQIITEALPDGPQTPPGQSYFTTGMELQRCAIVLAIRSGDLDVARAWLEAHDHWLAWSGSVLDQTERHLLWATYHSAAGDAGLAQEEAQRALAHAEAPRQPLSLIAARRLLGEFATGRGQFGEAEEHLAASLALADACAAPWERALTLLAIAELRIATGDRERTRSLLDEVRAICEPLDAQP